MNEIEGQHDMHDLWHAYGMICAVVSCCVMCMIHGLCCRWLGDEWDGTAAQRRRRGRGEVRSEEGLEAVED